MLRFFLKNSITFLGTGDGLSSPDRHHASLLVRLGGKTILLDCGEPCSHTLKRMGVDLDALDAVVITHTHSDHVGGFPMLLQCMSLEQRTRPLPVWLPRLAVAPLRRWLCACYFFDEALPFRVQWRPIPASPVRIGSARLRFWRTTHLDCARAEFAATYPGVGFDTYCVRLDAAGQSVGYSADLGQATDLLPLIARPLDVLVTELAHFHPDRLVEVLRGRPIKHVVVTHIGGPMKARLPEVHACLRRLHPIRVSFAADSDVVKVSQSRHVNLRPTGAITPVNLTAATSVKLK